MMDGKEKKKPELETQTCKNTPGILWDRPGMVASSVAGISPLLQGRNGYLPSIVRKGRVPDGNARKTE